MPVHAALRCWAFTDGFEFGFGAEIGISTQKLHARGPMGLKELTSYKYVIRGNTRDSQALQTPIRWVLAFRIMLTAIVKSASLRIGVCNACESLVVHSAVRKKLLPALAEALAPLVELRGDERILEVLPEALT